MISTIDSSIKNKIAEDRLIRYYISGSKGKTSISKIDLTTNKIISVNANSMITLAQKVKKTNIKGIYDDLDRQYYIDECYKIIRNYD